MVKTRGNGIDFVFVIYFRRFQPTGNWLKPGAMGLSPNTLPLVSTGG